MADGIRDSHRDIEGNVTTSQRRRLKMSA